VFSRIPVASNAAFVAAVLKMQRVLTVRDLDMVSTEDLIGVNIPRKDAAFLKLDRAMWEGLEQVFTSFEGDSSMCEASCRCRVRCAVYAHEVHSAQELLAKIDSIHMLSLGTKVKLRQLQQEPSHTPSGSGALDTAAPNGVAREQAVGDQPLLKLNFFVTPEGNKICISCNTECSSHCSDHSLTCLGCPAVCHFTCWRKARHCEWRDLVFVCLICRAQNAELNKRVQLMNFIMNPDPAKEQRCLECGTDPRQEECVICCLCGGCFCVDTCAILGLRVASGQKYPTPEGWQCRYCFGLEPYDDAILSRLDNLAGPAMQKAQDEGTSAMNMEAMTFVAMMSAAIDQQITRVKEKHEGNLKMLLNQEKAKCASNQKYTMSIEPMQLLSLPLDFITEGLAFACADSHARNFFDTAGGVSIESVELLPSSQCQRKRIGILTSDWGPHPTKEMLAGPLHALHLKHFELFFFLLVHYPKEYSELQEQYGRQNCCLLTKSGSDVTKAKQILLKQLDSVIFLDGHTGNGRGIFAELEKTVWQQKLTLKLFVWCAFPGVYGGRVSRTIVCPTTTKNKEIYGESKTAEMQCYHVRGDRISREECLNHAAVRKISRETTGIPVSAFVIGFPGRLARFHLETQRAFAIIAAGNPDVVFYFIAHTTSWYTVLNVFRSFCKLGVDSSRIKIGQCLPAVDNNCRLAAIVDLAPDAPGYGLHSMASLCTGLGIPVPALEDDRFHNNPAAAINKAMKLDELCVKTQDAFHSLLQKLTLDTEYYKSVKKKLELSARDESCVFNPDLAAEMLAKLLKLSFNSDAQHISIVQQGSRSDADMVTVLASDQPQHHPTHGCHSIRDRLMAPQWLNRMSSDPIRDIETLEKCLNVKTNMSNCTVILAVGEKTLVISGSATVGKGRHEKQLQVVIKAKFQEKDSMQREHAVMMKTKMCRHADNNCIPRAHPIFNVSNSCFSGLVTMGEWTLLAMDPLEAWMEGLMHLTRQEFMEHGRILDEWQHVFYQLFDAIMFLIDAKLTHGDLSPQHIMRCPKSRRVILIGLSHAGDALKPANTAVPRRPDLETAGMMLIYPMLGWEQLEDSPARSELEENIYGKLQAGSFPDLVDWVLGRLPSSVNPSQKGSGRYILEQLQHDPQVAESDPVMHIRQASVKSLLILALKCCGRDGSAKDGLLDGFLANYIPVSAEKEGMLVKEGERVLGGYLDGKSGERQKSCLVLLVPGQGLQVVALLDTAPGAPVGYYAGIFGPPGQNHHAWSAKRCRQHILPADTLSIDGCPGGPDLFLADLLEISAPGSLFASSRSDPSDSNCNSGNVSVPARNSKMLTIFEIRELDVRGLMMFSSQKIEWGSPYAWPYDWARVSGADAFSKQEISRRMGTYQAGLPEYTREIICKQRQYALDSGESDYRE